VGRIRIIAAPRTKELPMKDLTVALPYRPTLTRTLVKTATYKLFGLLAMLAIMLWHDHNWHAAITVGGLDLVVKTFIYITHERVWARIDTGKS
jgi:uncharacterized membrane protein